MSYTYLIYHVIFCTYKRSPSITIENEQHMYRAIYSLLIRAGAVVHRIGGMPDHIHVCFRLPADRRLSDVIKEVKRQTSAMFADRRIFPMWTGWGEGYAAFTCNSESIGGVIEYIKAQKTHHINESFVNEYRRWLIRHGCKDNDIELTKLEK